MDKTQRVLGIDPGSRVLGWGVVERRDLRYLRLVEYGTIRVNTDAPKERKLLEIHREIHKVFERMQPDIVSVEEVFYGKSFQSAMKIGEARGVCLLAAAERSYPIHHFAPAEVKGAVTGNGRAHKSQVQAMVTRILELDKVPKPADAADALACAICYCNRVLLV